MSQLILRRHPFDQEPGAYPVRAGQSLGAMLREGAQGAALSDLLVVSIGGIEVPRKHWDHVRPKEGTVIHVTGTVAGGSGGQILRSVLMIAVAAFAAWAAPFMVGAFGVFAGANVGLVQAGLYMLGALAVNALIPPPKPSNPSGTDGQWYMLTGTQNRANPFGAIPFVLGEATLFPPHAAIPYSQSVGEDSYQYCMFDLGYLTDGAEVDQIKIGETDIASFQDVTYEVTTAPTLYTSDVAESVVSAAMEDGDIVERTTAPDTEEISLDLVYIAGLFGVGTSGKDFARDAFWDVKYRATGSATWLDPPSPRLSGIAVNTAGGGMFKIRKMSKKPFAIGIAFDVPSGQYDVQVKRVSTPEGNSKNTYIDDCTWTVLRSIRRTNPSTTGTHKLALRIRANDQLNGTLQNLSCRVRQKIPVWNGTAWVPQFTNNTAWVFHWLISACPGVSNHAPSSRINLAQIAEYAAFCETHALETRRVVDSRSTMRDLINDVLAASLATLGMTNGKYGVVFDSGSETPSMVFADGECQGLSASRAFTRLPQALRVRFINPNAQWDMDEIVVPDDGYTWRGKDPRGNASADPEAQTFETLELGVACLPAQAWRLARHHLAQAKYRPTTYTMTTDIAALGCVRGDVVDVSSRVTEWGAGFGMVKSVTAGGPGAAVVVLDHLIETDPLKSYRAQVRRVDGSGVIVSTESYDVTPSAATTDTLNFATMPTLAAGDMVIVGETGNVTQRLILTDIGSQPDLGFGLRAVPYDSRVAPYWANPPASFISEITGSRIEPPDPPNITVVISNPANDPRDDGGTSTPSVHIYNPPTNGYTPPRETRTMLQ